MLARGRRRHRTRRAAVAVTLLAIAGGVLIAWASDSATTPSHPRAALLRRANGDLDALARKVAARVERIRGLRFRQMPSVVTMDRVRLERLGRRIARRAQARAAERPGRLERTARLERASRGFEQLAGLLPPQISYSPDTTAGLERIGGAFDYRRNRIVIVPGVIGSRDQLRYTLAHELTHALESERFHLGLTALTAPTEAARSRRALVEGTATFVQARYQRRFLHDQVPIASRLAGLRSLIAAASVPYALGADAGFDYVDGSLFARRLFRRAHGWNAVNRALRRPPRRTSQILHPRTWPDVPAAKRVRLGTRRVLGARWRQVGGGVAGEGEARVILFANRIALEAQAGASGWAGGRFELWRRRGAPPPCAGACAEGEVGVVAFRWRQAGDADQFALAVPPYMIIGLFASRVENSTWQLRDGYAALGSSARGSALAFAPSPALAARLAGRAARRAAHSG